MEKEFVPYEPSLVLKELGFDEPCFWYYLENDISAPADFSRKGRVYPSNSDLILEWVSAPLYQQAFRFFREKYGYDVSIKKCTSTQYKFVITQSFVENDYYFIDFPFPSHEEAELECLKKLIEIVKRKVV
jgi:hypothetical protein